jgi:acetyltransferase-like isoleucine patch superfamily enzyme
MRRLFFPVYFSYNALLLASYGVKTSCAKNLKGIVCIKGEGRLLIGSNFRANSGQDFNTIGGDSRLQLILAPEGFLSIGNNCGISNSTIVSHKRIKIGNNVLIGGGVKIYDTDFHSLCPVSRMERHTDIANTRTKEVSIEDNVLIGAHSIILKGSTVGANSIIGAGTVLAGTVPPNEIWAGNPAKFISSVEIFDGR